MTSAPRSPSSSPTGSPSGSPVPGPGAPAGGVTYAERLLPGVGGWLGIVVVAGVIALMLSVATVTASVVGGLLVLVVGAVVAWRSSPVVEVRDGELRAGQAHIPVALLGEATVLDRAGVSLAMGTGWDPRAYACLRTWAGSGLRVEVLDPADPTPYWIVSTRRPHDVAAAISAQV